MKEERSVLNESRKTEEQDESFIAALPQDERDALLLLKSSNPEAYVTALRIRKNLSQKDRKHCGEKEPSLAKENAPPATRVKVEDGRVTLTPSRGDWEKPDPSDQGR